MGPEAIRRLRREPAFAAYLLALALLPIKWLSPLTGLSERAGWTDVFAAVAVVLWLAERRYRSFPWRPRVFYIGIGAYLLAGALSAAIASSDHRTAVENVVIMVELAALAVLTADFAREPARRAAVVVVVAGGVLVTAAIAVVALVLFYAGVHTSALGSYGEQLIPSGDYARISAGFYSAPLLGSFCIFASAMVASDDAPLSPALRRLTQACAAVLVVLTVSRAAIGFAAAAGIRWAHRRGTRAAAALAVAGCVGAIALMAGLTVGRLRVDPTRPSSIAYRVPDPGNRREAFTSSLDTLGDHPVLGKGPGSFPGTNRGEPFRAHFTPLNIAATVGLPALIALVVALGSLWTARRRPTDVAVWSGLAGLGIDALGQDVEHFRHVWVMIGMAGATAAAADSAGESPERRQ